MVTTSESREFWRTFIAAYRDLPELWMVKSDDYKNRTKKDAAYEKLVEMLKEVDPNADRGVVRNKINTLRTSYRRELRKVRDSIKRGGGTDVYAPSLWYYYDIDFLSGQGTPEDNEDCDDIKGVEEDFLLRSAQELPIPKRKENPNTSDSVETKRARTFDPVNDHFTSTASDAQIIARGWAIEFGKMSPDQQLFAKKFIDDIIFEGRLGNLHRHSIVINNSFNHHPP